MGNNGLALTQEQIKLFRYINSLVSEKGNLVYDLTDPKQYQFAVLMNELGGFSRECYPGFNGLLDDARERQQAGICEKVLNDNAGEAFQTAFDIYTVGTTNDVDKLACGNGYGTVAGGFNAANLSYVIMDVNSGSFLASGANAAYNSAYLKVDTDVSTAQPITDGAVAYMHYSAQTQDGTPIQSGVIVQPYLNATVGDPHLDAPKRRAQKPYNTKAINIGLGRPWEQPDTDYNWVEQMQNQPIGKIPFVGNVCFNYPICTPLKRGQNLIVNISVQNGTGGGRSVLNPEDMDNVYNSFSIDTANPNQLNWNLPAGTSDTDPGNPIVFSQITWPTDMLSYFSCSIIVMLQNGSTTIPAFANIISSDSPDTDPNDGTLYIMPIEFIWHCLGEGTQVLLEDGSTVKAIESFKAGDAVATGNNSGKKTVTATNRGAHSGGALKIITEIGNSLITTHGHVIITPEGAVQASELKVGDEVTVRGGSAKISSLEEIRDYNGLFYNLCVGEYVDHKESGAGMGTFFANGILVGDIRAQRVLKYQRSRDKDYLKVLLGDFWAKDIESYFRLKK